MTLHMDSIEYHIYDIRRTMVKLEFNVRVTLYSKKGLQNTTPYKYVLNGERKQLCIALDAQ